VEYVAQIDEIIHKYEILVGESEEKRQLGRRRCRWEDNIKTDLKETDNGMGG
jgi:hypothetical protein